MVITSYTRRGDQEGERASPPSPLACFGAKHAREQGGKKVVVSKGSFAREWQFLLEEIVRTMYICFSDHFRSFVKIYFLSSVTEGFFLRPSGVRQSVGPEIPPPSPLP